MNRYRVEIIGRVPNGLTSNDVHASVQQILNEFGTVELITKRRLAGNTISMIVTFQAESVVSARAAVHRSITGVLGFSADTFGFRDLGGVK